MPAPRPLPLLWLRVVIDYLASRRRGELADGALHPIALTILPHRGHLVVIGRLWLQIHQANPENRLWMGPVEPDMTSCCLAQILGIRPVMHDAIMLVVAARIGGGPPYNRHPGIGRFELRRFGDLDVLSPLLPRKDLSDGQAGEEQAAGRGSDCQFHEQSVH